MAATDNTLDIILAHLIEQFKTQKMYSKAFIFGLSELGYRFGLDAVGRSFQKQDRALFELYTSRILANPEQNMSYVWFATQHDWPKDVIYNEQFGTKNNAESNKKYVENNGVKEQSVWTDNSADSDSAEHGENRKMSSGYQYITNPARRKYKHMRLMVQNHWSYNKTSPVSQFDIDSRFQYNDTAIAQWIETHLTVSDINSAHQRVQQMYSEQGTGRGRPKGARNKDKVRQDMSETERRELDELADELNEDTTNNTATQSNSKSVDQNELMNTLNNVLRTYVQHSDLNNRDYATKQNVIDSARAMQNAVETYIRDQIKTIQVNTPRELIIKNVTTAATTNVGIQHKHFEVLLQASSARDTSGNRRNIWLFGPAGTGKTTASINVAKALGLNYIILAKLETAYQIWGYNSADGTYIPTLFRKAWEHGGVIILDEIDGFSSQASLALNGALANGVCSFPDKMVSRHPDCLVIAGANTTGLGGTDEYVGRTKLDAATLDRFDFIPWPIDDALESHMSSCHAWLNIVRVVRANVKSVGLKNVLITPRATIHGEALLKQGLSVDWVMQMTLKKGMSEAQWNQVKPSIATVSMLETELARISAQSAA